MKRTKRALGIVGIIIGLGLIGAIAFATRILNRFRDGNTSLGEVVAGIRDPRGVFKNQNHLNLLLIGQDYNHDNRGYMSSKNTRADTVMMLSVDLDKKTIRACSVPRDTYVQAPDGKTGKINATYTRGGAHFLEQTLENLFDIKIDNYFVIKADAVRNIVDSVGGVEVEALDAMNYDDNWGGLHVHLPAGKQKLDGKGAEGFVRFREVNRYRMDEDGHMIPLHGVKHSKEEGDLRRMARQQQMIQALIRAANSPSNMVKADSIIETGFQQVDTDLPRLKCLALATLFRGSSHDSMVTGTLPGKDSKKNGVYFYVLDDERAKDTVDWLIKGDDTAARKLVRIGIKNGTKVNGVAKAVAEKLVGEGYTASSMGNAPPATTTLIAYQKSSHMDIAKVIQQMIGAPSIQKSVAVNPAVPDIEVVIGDDIAKKLQPAATPSEGKRSNVRRSRNH